MNKAEEYLIKENINNKRLVKETEFGHENTRVSKVMEAYHLSRINEVSVKDIVEKETEHLHPSDYLKQCKAYVCIGAEAVINLLKNK